MKCLNVQPCFTVSPSFWAEGIYAKHAACIGLPQPVDAAFFGLDEEVLQSPLFARACSAKFECFSSLCFSLFFFLVLVFLVYLFVGCMTLVARWGGVSNGSNAAWVHPVTTRVDSVAGWLHPWWKQSCKLDLFEICPNCYQVLCKHSTIYLFDFICGLDFRWF